jgi:Glycine zipper
MNMKRFLPFLSFAFIFAACSSPSETELKTVQSANHAPANTDTAGLAQFQQWKAQNELTAANNFQEVSTPAEQPVKTVTVIREVQVQKPAPVRKQSTATRPAQKRPAAPSSDNTSETTTDNTDPGTLPSGDNAGSGTGSTPDVATAPTTETAKKEGWSKAAKGAAIGGAGGAVIGAVISKKNPAVGAAIGGVLGGAVGYGIGRAKDKKDGRY